MTSASFMNTLDRLSMTALTAVLLSSLPLSAAMFLVRSI